jgi:hypothetical protein
LSGERKIALNTLTLLRLNYEVYLELLSLGPEKASLLCEKLSEQLRKAEAESTQRVRGYLVLSAAVLTLVAGLKISIPNFPLTIDYWREASLLFMLVSWIVLIVVAQGFWNTQYCRTMLGLAAKQRVATELRNFPPSFHVAPFDHTDFFTAVPFELTSEFYTQRYIKRPRLEIFAIVVPIVAMLVAFLAWHFGIFIFAAMRLGFFQWKLSDPIWWGVLVALLLNIVALAAASLPMFTTTKYSDRINDAALKSEQ